MEGTARGREVWRKEVREKERRKEERKDGRRDGGQERGGGEHSAQWWKAECKRGRNERKELKRE